MGEPCKAGNNGASSSSSNQIPNSEPSLDLGLSLGGCYSQTNPTGAIPQTTTMTTTLLAGNPPRRNNNDVVVLTDFFAVPVIRMPTEAELEVTRVKQAQARKRFEAKKRLAEKQIKRAGYGGGCRPEKIIPPAPAATENDFASWAIGSASKNTAFVRAMEKLQGNNNGDTPSHTLWFQGAQNTIPTKFPTIAQPTFISMANGNGNGKSVFVNYQPDGKLPMPGSSLSTSVPMANKTENGKQPATPNSRPETDQQRNKLFKKGKRVLPNGAEMMNEICKLMPSVITTGNGPMGRTIEGFLHKYETGKVKIVCVCHGSFFTPAEFVEHAGGSKLQNPTKHIHVLASLF